MPWPSFLSWFTRMRGETVRQSVLRGRLGTLPSMRRAYQTDLSDAEWSYLEPLERTREWKGASP